MSGSWWFSITLFIRNNKSVCLFVCLFKFSTPNSGEKAAQFPFCAGEDLVEDWGLGSNLSSFSPRTTFSACGLYFAVHDLDLCQLNSVLMSNTFYKGATVVPLASQRPPNVRNHHSQLVPLCDWCIEIKNPKEKWRLGDSNRRPCSFYSRIFGFKML